MGNIFPGVKSALKKGISSLSLRALFVYFLAVVGPAVLLLYLGLRTVQRQRQIVANLSVTNLRLSGERLISELERRVWRAAELCLRDQGISPVLLTTDYRGTFESAKKIRALLESVRHRHPIARHFYVWQDRAVCFPPLESPPPQRPGGLFAGEDLDVRRQFEALFNEGEDQELLKQRPDLALPAYERGARLPVSDRLKALASSRAARCLQKMKKTEEAQQAYQKILAQYGDVYDPFHRPYALIAALELGDLAVIQGIPAPPSLLGVYDDLVRGRWEMSTEHMDYFLGRFRHLVKEAPLPETEYFHHLDSARALQDGFRHQGPLQPDKVYTNAITRNEADHQIFYTLIPTGSKHEVMLGFAIDLAWVKSDLLPQCTTELGLAGSFGLALKSTRIAAQPGNSSEPMIAFKTLFPFWGLSATTALSEAQQTVARRETLVLGGAIMLILGVLGLGLFLIIRDARREMRLARVRSDLVSGVSHELRTPLTLIRLYGEMLLYGEDLQEEERKSYYQIITGEGERLTHLIENVLDFSHIDRGLKRYNLIEGDLGSVIGRVAEIYGPNLKRQGFTIEANLAAELPPVRFDPEAVSQAVINLIDNAARYSGQSKFIGLRLRCMDSDIIFEVEDHGPGIASDDRAKIFNQFYRGPESGKKGGYGLGLYLVKHIMGAHGGKIELESEVGCGSLFRLVFPCSRS